jgi:hypothetical protein
MKQITVVFYAHGHKNVQSTHRTTIEVTKELTLTKRGNCIIAVGSTKAAFDLPTEFKKAAKKKNSKITIIIEADGLKETVHAKGSLRLQFTHTTDLVVRKSDYVCGRTLAIDADKAANNLSKELIEKLKDPNQTIKITLTAH